MGILDRLFGANKKQSDGRTRSQAKQPQGYEALIREHASAPFGQTEKAELERAISRLESTIERCGIRFPASRVIRSGRLKDYPVVNLGAFQFVLGDDLAFTRQQGRTIGKEAGTNQNIEAIISECARKETEEVASIAIKLARSYDHILLYLEVFKELFSEIFEEDYSLKEEESGTEFSEQVRIVRFLFPQEMDETERLLKEIVKYKTTSRGYHLTSSGEYAIGWEITATLKFGISGSWDRVAVKGKRSFSFAPKTFGVAPK
jgi:hypothetical protein